jgi:DNA repair exonuclease SbcCD ATPase subunit
MTALEKSHPGAEVINLHAGREALLTASATQNQEKITTLQTELHSLTELASKLQRDLQNAKTQKKKEVDYSTIPEMKQKLDKLTEKGLWDKAHYKLTEEDVKTILQTLQTQRDDFLFTVNRYFTESQLSMEEQRELAAIVRSILNNLRDLIKKINELSGK